MGWGAPRIHGELLKLGIEVSQATVSKYMRHPNKSPLLALHGKTLLLNALSDPSAEIVWITSLSSTSGTCDGFFENTLIITIPAGLTCP